MQAWCFAKLLILYVKKTFTKLKYSVYSELLPRPTRWLLGYHVYQLLLALLMNTFVSIITTINKTINTIYSIDYTNRSMSIIEFITNLSSLNHQSNNWNLSISCARSFVAFDLLCCFLFCFCRFWCLQKGNRIAGDPVAFFMAHKKGLKKSYNSFLFD